MQKLTIPAVLLLSALWAGPAMAEPPPQVQLCMACHGMSGESTSAQWPNLGGQNEAYLARQIRAFRDGERKNPSMTPFVKDLSDGDIKALAKHYASQDLVVAAEGDPDLVDAGEQLAGYCSACHGYAGKPVANEWPILAGQRAAYLEQQLTAYKRGDRDQPLMQSVIDDFGEREFAALAAYYSQLRP